MTALLDTAILLNAYKIYKGSFPEIIENIVLLVMCAALGLVCVFDAKENFKEILANRRKNHYNELEELEEEND